MDIGSTGVKAVAFNPEGTILASAYREYPEILPRPNRVELDPNQVFSGILEVLNEVCEAVNDDPPRTLCMSTMGETFTPMDAEGNFLHNSIVSPDNRAIAQAESWAETLGFERVFEITAIPPPEFHHQQDHVDSRHHAHLHARTTSICCAGCGDDAAGDRAPHRHSLAARTWPWTSVKRSFRQRCSPPDRASMLAEPIHWARSPARSARGPRSLPACLSAAWLCGGHDSR